MIHISPDGLRYLQMAARRAAPQPFHLRWFVPALCGDSIRRWQIATYVGYAVFVICVGLMGGWTAALLVATLSGPALGFRLPVLIDAPALGMAALAAATVDIPILSVMLALIAGMTSERAPLFAALWAWSPIPLVGLIAPAVRALLFRPGPDVDVLIGTDAGNALIAPWRIGLRRNWHDINLIAPWGGLLAAFLWMDMRMAITMIVAYGQLAVATDTIRLYQWSAPVLAIALSNHLDWHICIILALITWFNPLRGDGI